jgi:AraC family transcriptional regulator of arabinose operon
MWLHFTGSDVEDILKKYELLLYPNVNMIEPDETIIMRFQNIFNAFIRNEKYRDNELSTLLDRLLISLARRVSGEKKLTNFLNKSIAYINSNYADYIRVPDLARMENLSVSRYNTLFKQITGDSPVEYIKKMRLNSACELLSVTDLPIKTISAMVGYSDSHFFSRIFKKNLGISPAFYRRKEQ